MMAIKFIGLDKLEAKLKDNVSMDDVKRVVHHNGSEMQQKIMRNANFKKGYSTGATKRSITLSVQDNGLTAEVQPTTEYSPYPEYGTRFMQAQPFVRPGFEEQKKKFISDMKKLTK